MDNICVKHQIGRVGTKLWPGHDVNRRTDRRTDRQTDGQTDGQDDSYIAPSLFAGGINSMIQKSYPRTKIQAYEK